MGSVYLIHARAKAHAERQFPSTDEFVQWLANEAVKDAWEANHVKLDYSVESIKSVEQILGGLHTQYTKDPSTISVKGLAAAYGAYIGEVIHRSEPNAHWQRDDEKGKKSYPIIWGPAAGHSYPMAWCYNRILNGDEDNV
ncbi:MAG TPA: hypothetical protein VJN89_10090 [Candidatus Acidoferrum sp.]|nr:hypothetical protein [Candidatus Acidoferrum sp.]